MHILQFDTLESTNKYCKLLDLRTVEEFTVIWAHSQPSGIGQVGNRWVSEPDANLTFSIVLKPLFLPPSAQFALTEAVSLGVVDWLDSMGVAAQIKWPNDIYVGDKKICGILIENHIGQQYESAVCGIGININQYSFPSEVPNPVSLSQITGKQYDLNESIDSLLRCIEERYTRLKTEGRMSLTEDYLSHLLNLNVDAEYLYRGQMIRARVMGVSEFGCLRLELADGRQITCGMQEIKFLEFYPKEIR